ncbi:Mur ligase domain-containing protein [Salinispora arenicola]|uniref:Mur ligase domain-containing protein n=1 Tax=Salinispora arenicola TaxID=168697 RepID=UPI000379B632|nr:Mur ligase domain-containing protein [Salinispora arenicola]
MTLQGITAVVGGAVHDAPQGVTVTAPVVFDSRRVEAGGMFVALPGERVDGHDYAAQAIEAGAAAVLASRPVGVPAVVVEDVPTAYGRLARAVVEGTVNRRQFLSSTAATAASGFLYDPSIPAQPIGDHEAVDWLAWHLWQNRKDELDPSRIPQAISHRLNAHPHVLRTAGGAYRFTDPALTDVLVAHRVFGDIAQGSGHLLATAQTSHATDLTISALAAENEQARRGLTAWMRSGATAVLRVNSAGILAKVGAADLSDAAISAIRSDRDARHLYVTAVASRVLELPWGRAADLSGATNTHAADWTLGEGDGTKAWASRRLADELANNRDAAARWCSAVLLATCIDVEDTRMRSALMLAVKNEPCRENLRAYAAVLAGATPLKIG